MNEIIKTADILYKEMNPNTKMDTPNGVYEKFEKWYYEYIMDSSQNNLSFIDWIRKNKK